MLRLGHLYGPGSSFAPEGGFARRLRAGKLPLVGDGASMFSFIHVHDVATAILAAVEHPTARGVLNIVDDQPTLVHDWLPEMAAMLGAPAPRHVPALLARLFVGEWGVAYMTGLAGASNMLARHQLDWKPAYSSWRDGLAADLGARLADENRRKMRTITEDAGSLASATVVAGVGAAVVSLVQCAWAAAHLGDRRRHLARGTSSEAMGGSTWRESRSSATSCVSRSRAWTSSGASRAASRFR